MKSPVAMARRAGAVFLSRSRQLPSRAAAPAGYTLVEILVATALTLLLMAGVVTLFGQVTESVSRGQSMMDLVDRLRAAQHRLQTDLKYHTAPMVPPLDPRNESGYFEVLDGPGPYLITGVGNVPVNQAYLTDGVDNDGDGTTDELDEAIDSTVGDNDDVLMLTVRSYGEPFLGRFGFGGAGVQTMQSQVAEIAWFVRGTTLYRRVLLIVPQRVFNPQQPFYRDFDVSVHQEGGPAEAKANWGNNTGDERLITNSLGDLTKRENRYGHLPLDARIAGSGFPHDARMWGALGLPTLRECSHPNWPYPLFGNSPNPPGGSSAAFNSRVDYWAAPHQWPNSNVNIDQETGTLQNYVNNDRMAEDVILTNVLSFDIKVWDPDAPVLYDNAIDRTLVPGDTGYLSRLQQRAGTNNNNGPVRVVSFGAYVDLFYLRGLGNNWQTVLTNMSTNIDPGRVFAFAGPGAQQSRLQAALDTAAVYDTGSPHYEYDGINQADWSVPGPLVDEGTDGLDNNNVGGVDDVTERETLPPYPFPLRSVQIKLRVYERDTQQIREVTVTQDFVK